MSYAERYPFNTSHYKRWIAADYKTYCGIRDELQQRAWDRFFARCAARNLPLETVSAIKTRFTQPFVDEIFHWTILTSLDIWSARLLDFRILNTAFTLFKRYFLRRTILDVVPQRLIMTCLLVATKIENSCAEFRPIQALFGPEEREQFPSVVALETELLRYTFYDFFVVHGDAVLNYYMTQYFWFRQKRGDHSVPKHWSPLLQPSLRFRLKHDGVVAELGEPECSPEKKLESWLEYASTQAQALYLSSHITQMHFYATPAMIAAAVFVFYMEGYCNMPDVQDFLEEVLPEEVQADRNLKARFRAQLLELINEVSIVYSVLESNPLEKNRAATVVLLKVLRKLGLYSVTKKKRLLASEESGKRMKAQET